MKLTAITGNLNQHALQSLTAKARDPEYESLKVAAEAFNGTERGLTPCLTGQLFHKSCAALFAGERFPAGTECFLPYAHALRAHLHRLGFTRFEAEVPVRRGEITGRADLIALASRRRAVVEFKVCDMPWEADAETMVQAASYGYMLPRSFRYLKTGLIVFYVDLRRRRIEAYRWDDFRQVSKPLRELRAAA